MKDSPSKTAKIVCLMRAQESMRPKSLCILNDPYAKYFLDAKTRLGLNSIKFLNPFNWDLFVPGFRSIIVTRHRFMDDSLETALSTDKIKQVVILGAGYDMRAFRFAKQLKDIPYFELDHPSTNEEKTELLKKIPNLPEVDRRALKVNFQEESFDDVLKSAGFKIGEPTFFIWEGVSMYLNKPSVEKTLEIIRKISSEDSLLTMDFCFYSGKNESTISYISQKIIDSILYFSNERLEFLLPPAELESFTENNHFSIEKLMLSSDMEKVYGLPAKTLFMGNYSVLLSPHIIKDENQQIS